jgi:hypothetical protein
MEVGNFTLQLIYPQEELPLSTESLDGWDPEPVWIFWSREKSLAPTGIRTPAHPPQSLVTIPILAHLFQQ